MRQCRTTRRVICSAISWAFLNSSIAYRFATESKYDRPLFGGLAGDQGPLVADSASSRSIFRKRRHPAGRGPRVAVHDRPLRGSRYTWARARSEATWACRTVIRRRVPPCGRGSGGRPVATPADIDPLISAPPPARCPNPARCESWRDPPLTDSPSRPNLQSWRSPDQACCRDDRAPPSSCTR